MKLANFSQWLVNEAHICSAHCNLAVPSGWAWPYCHLGIFWTVPAVVLCFPLNQSRQMINHQMEQECWRRPSLMLLCMGWVPSLSPHIPSHSYHFPRWVGCLYDLWYLWLLCCKHSREDCPGPVPSLSGQLSQSAKFFQWNVWFM